MKQHFLTDIAIIVAAIVVVVVLVAALTSGGPSIDRTPGTALRAASPFKTIAHVRSRQHAFAVEKAL